MRLLSIFISSASSITTPSISNQTYWKISTPAANLTFELKSNTISILQPTQTSYNTMKIKQGRSIFYAFEGLKQLGIELQVFQQDGARVYEMYMDFGYGEKSLLLIKQIISQNSTNIVINQPKMVDSYNEILKHRFGHQTNKRVGLGVGGLVLVIALMAYLLVLGDEEMGENYCDLETVFVEQEKEELLPAYELEYKLLK